MSTRDALLNHLWTEVINPAQAPNALENTIQHCEKRPDDPFADTGPALKRLLALGADPQDIALIMRAASYEAVFGTLYALDDPGLDDGEEPYGLHESLLSADPSGLEGRPK